MVFGRKSLLKRGGHIVSLEDSSIMYIQWRTHDFPKGDVLTLHAMHDDSPGLEKVAERVWGRGSDTFVILQNFGSNFQTRDRGILVNHQTL